MATNKHTENNLFGVKESIDLQFYDEKGNFIVETDTLKKTYIRVDEKGKGSIKTTDALLNKQLLDFIFNNTQKQSDYETNLDKKTKAQTISINNKAQSVPCKIIGETHFRKYSDMKDTPVVFQIDHAEIIPSFNYIGEWDSDPAVFEIHIKIHPDDEGNLFQIHIKQ